MSHAFQERYPGPRPQTMILIIAPAVADSWPARVYRPVRGVGPLGPALADVATHTGALGENTADADMTGAGKTDAGAPAAGESAGAAVGMPREPVPAWRSGSPIINPSSPELSHPRRRPRAPTTSAIRTTGPSHRAQSGTCPEQGRLPACRDLLSERLIIGWAGPGVVP